MSIMILHHNDADGRCSAAVAIKYLKQYDFTWIARELDYEQEIGDIPEGIVTIYVLDLSFSPKIMRKLVEKYDVIWIDHHITAIEKLDEFKDLIGIRRDGTAACILTWEHFLPEQDMPAACKYIGDRDVWKFEYGELTENFHELFLVHDPNPESPVWDEWFKGIDPAEMTFGALLRRANLRDIRNHVDQHAWPMDLYLKNAEGKSSIASGAKVNMSDKRQFSEAGSYLLNEKGMDFVWLFFEGMMDGRRIRYNSMRSIDYDVGQYALERNGGGHFRASGFIEILDQGRQAAKSPPGSAVEN